MVHTTCTDDVLTYANGQLDMFYCTYGYCTHCLPTHTRTVIPGALLL